MDGSRRADTPGPARVDWRLWGIILALATALRLYGLGTEPLWLDEAYSWWDAQQSLGNLWSLVTQCDPHPPLYAVLLKGWVAIAGDSSAALRGLGALASIATTLVTMFAAREISVRAAWIAGLLGAIAPFQIEFAHEARPYTLVALGAALMAFGALRLLASLRESVRTPAGWISLVAGSTIALWSNNTSVLMVAAMAIFLAGLGVLDRKSRVLIRPAVVAGLAIALIWLPYLSIYLQQARGIANDFWIPTPDLWRIANELRFVVGLGEFGILGAVCVVWLTGLAMLWRRGRKREAWLLASLVVLPVALNFAISVTIKPIFLARALIGIAPAFLIALAAALAAIELRWLRWLAIGGLATARLLPALAFYAEPNRKEQWDDIAQHIVVDVGRDALVLLIPNELALPLGHALSDAHSKLKMRGVPVDFPAPGRAARYPSGKCTPSVVGADLGALAEAVRKQRIVAVVTRQNNIYDPKEVTQAMLRSVGMQLFRTKEFMPGYLQVQTFVAPNRPVIQTPRHF